MTLIGRVGTDPEMRGENPEKQATLLSLATSRSYKNQDGKLILWINVSASYELYILSIIFIVFKNLKLLLF